MHLMLMIKIFIKIKISKILKRNMSKTMILNKLNT